MSFSVVIASYGEERWRKLGDSRALPSVVEQGALEILRVHQPEGNVATSRNEGGRAATGDWLIFLDADDELGPGYVDAMRHASRRQPQPTLLAPATSYVRGRPRPPMFWPECDLRRGNWLVIGTAVPRDLFLDVGGFDDRPDYGAFEDWALWIKCWKAGARPVKVPDAVYIAHVLTGSRHRGAPLAERHGWHYAIGRDHFPDIYDKHWLAESQQPPRRPRRGITRRHR